MLKSLHINNFALIEQSDVVFNQGFSVITGETGAGKSILLGAIGLLLGQKSDVNALKDPSQKCVVEAEFDVSDYDLQPFFTDNDLDYETVCVIRREIAPTGKSRAFVNDTPVNVSVLKTLGDRLVDIHSQHQNLLLSNSNFQLDVVDVVSGDNANLDSYKKDFSEFKKDKAALEKLVSESRQAQSDLDFISFQFNQLDEASLVAGEQEQLEQEQLLLQNAEGIKEAVSKSCWSIVQDDNSVCSSLKESVSSLGSVSDSYPKLKELAERLNSALIDLKDVGRELESLQNELEVDPARLGQVDARLDVLYSLEKKHHVDSVDELIALRDEYGKKLQLISSSDEEIETLKNKIDERRKKLVELASRISDCRKKGAVQIESQLQDILVSLGMPNAKLKIQFDDVELNEYGADQVSFLFSANKDNKLQPVSSIASGGEMARVMLGLKSILSKSKSLPTIIFDEIDTGVSGDIASKMGSIMQSMGQNMQVVSITHLPQIAAKGKYHYKVYKTDTDSTTNSHIDLLDEAERVNFIAKLLSGDRLSDAAIQNAKELLNAK